MPSFKKYEKPCPLPHWITVVETCARLITTNCIVPGCKEVIKQDPRNATYSLCMCGEHTWTKGRVSRVHVANPTTWDLPPEK